LREDSNLKAKILSLFVFMLLSTVSIGVTITAEKNNLTHEIIESLSITDPIILENENSIGIEINEETSKLMLPGMPILPIVTKTYYLPFGTDVKNVVCSPCDISKSEIAGEIESAPQPRLVSSMNSLENSKFTDEPIYRDSNVYDSKDFFPNSWFTYTVGSGLDNTRHVKILNIKISPVRYSPAGNIIKFANSFDIKVEYNRPVSPLTFPDEYDMIIITPEEFSEKIEPLVDYRNDCFIETICTTTQDIYNGEYFPVNGRDNAERIKYFIKDAIENWNITYVLLAGGVNKVPARPSYVQDGEEINFLSDLYYADIYDSHDDFCSWDSNNNDLFGEYNYEGRTDTVDLYPDICLGRLNFRDIDEIDSVISKIINYESKGAVMQDWFSDMILIGGDTFDDFQSVLEGEHLNQNALSYMSGFSEEKVWASNGKLQFAVNIDSAVENGSGFLYMTGHGTHDNWVTHPHNNFDVWWPLTGYFHFRVELLNNQELLPVVVIGGCSNCQFSAKNCFGWSWVKNPDGGGIASYGYSALGWGIPGYGCTDGLTGGMEMSAFKAYGPLEAKSTGDLWVKALNNYLNEFGVWSAHGYKCVEEWQPFSDPSLRIRKVSDFPNVPETPDGPATGGVGLEYEYTTLSTDPNGGYIKYYFDWGDGTIIGSDWYSSGETAYITHKWNAPGSYEIKAKARDQFGLDSDWSESFTVTIVSEAPYFDVIDVKGGIGTASATIKNIGLLDAYDVNCNITVNGGILKLIDKFSEETYETLMVDEEITIGTDGIFGIGKINVIISANSPSANETIEEFQGFVLGPIVIIR
jgi:hypothetical protein